MSRIHLLPEEVASQVAAGEVVERPASVVKELVENSIDAQATRVEVMIRRGGSSMIRVVDDGVGMDRDDALLCLERHATSKIRTGHDLAAIATLGFRGEAVPSIASVSRFRVTTRERTALVGTEVLVNGGKIEAVRDSGEAPGTQIEVRSLFYNLPARRKFLRAETTEASHVEHQLHLLAIGHPGVGFVYIKDERLVFQLPPAGSLADRVKDLAGTALVAQLIEVEPDAGAAILVRGLIGKPGVSRSSKAQQIVFVNGRAIENSTIQFALREGYHTALMKGQYPVTYLFIEMEPAAVDVNVHPAKREVRFRDPASVREAVVASVRCALEANRGPWSRAFAGDRGPHGGGDVSSAPPSNVEAPMTGPTLSQHSSTGSLPLIPIQEQVALRTDWALLPKQPLSQDRARAESSEMPQGPGAPPAETARSQPMSAQRTSPSEFKILGVLGRLYVLMENSEGLVLVDQHAAHERVLFEELRRRMEAQGVPSQRLLMPHAIQVSPRDADWITQNLGALQKMGIGLEEFGSGTFKLDSLPQFLRGGDPLKILRDIIDELRTLSTATSKLRLGEDMIATTVCRHAVKANDELHEAELVKLIQDLLRCELPYCCPHGRPTMIEMSYAELEKKFGRRQ